MISHKQYLFLLQKKDNRYDCRVSWCDGCPYSSNRSVVDCQFAKQFPTHDIDRVKKRNDWIDRQIRIYKTMTVIKEIISC